MCFSDHNYIDVIVSLIVQFNVFILLIQIYYMFVSVCIHPGSISNGDIIISLNRTVAIYICNNGFTLDGTATRFCKDDGSGWAEDEPKCGKNL